MFLHVFYIFLTFSGFSLFHFSLPLFLVLSAPSKSCQLSTSPHQLALHPQHEKHEAPGQGDVVGSAGKFPRESAKKHGTPPLPSTFVSHNPPFPSTFVHFWGRKNRHRGDAKRLSWGTPIFQARLCIFVGIFPRETQQKHSFFFEVVFRANRTKTCICCGHFPRERFLRLSGPHCLILALFAKHAASRTELKVGVNALMVKHEENSKQGYMP